MFQVGPLEIVVVLVIALLVIGPQKLPDVARSVGRGMREFRSAIEGEEEQPAAQAPAAQPQAVEPPAKTTPPAGS